MRSVTVGPHGYSVNGRGHLEIGGVDALDLARQFGTPLHVLDEDRLRDNCRRYRSALARSYGEGRVVYASKACCILATCQIAVQEGLGVDVASGGELHTALRAGVPPADVVFHGSNKTAQEVAEGLRAGVGRFVVDNDHELDLLEELAARLDTTADVLLRVTPGVEPHTHRAIRTGGVDSKFGFPLATGSAHRAVARVLRSARLRLWGVHTHIGSQIADLEPFCAAAEAVVEFAAEVREAHGAVVEEVNMGGGLAIRYLSSDSPPSIEAYVDAVAGAVGSAARRRGLPRPRLYLEPGRSIVGDAGVTLYTVGAVKVIPGVRTYVSVDGGMYENPRPALYGSRYEAVVADRPLAPAAQTVSLAGRCCESGDVLIWEAALPPVRSGDVVAVFSTGAYTYSMASNYNRFPRPAVVLAGDGRARVVVERESYDDLIRKDVPL
ncbi:MAG: diaminopimelate decarboxylase [Armatimonadota bacterium]|nr:diaminopimelate decarboxylase [Armatimonadota bacterium]